MREKPTIDHIGPCCMGRCKVPTGVRERGEVRRMSDTAVFDTISHAANRSKADPTNKSSQRRSWFFVTLPSMQIQQYEQSGCIITSQRGQTLAIDIGSLTPVEKLADITVDAMLVSHIHADHCSAEHVAALQPKELFTGAECARALAELDTAISIITAGEQFTTGDFTVTPFEVDHGPNAPRAPEQNFGFLITVDEQTIYFAGDMYTPSGIDVRELAVDVALLPVGGHYTFDAEAALAFAQRFARIGTIYPMHYEAVGPIDTAGKEKFTALASNQFTVA